MSYVYIYTYTPIPITTGQRWIYTESQLYQLHQPNWTVCWMSDYIGPSDKCWPVSTSVLWWGTIQYRQLWQHRRGEMWLQVPLDHQTIRCITGDKSPHYTECWKPFLFFHRLCNIPRHLPIQWNEHNIRSRSNRTTGSNRKSSACFKNRFYYVDGKFMHVHFIYHF